MDATNSQADRLLTIGEASVRLGVHADTLRSWEDAGTISSTRTVGGHRRYRESDIDALLTARSA